jgi:hypothetical protein
MSFSDVRSAVDQPVVRPLALDARSRKYAAPVAGHGEALASYPPSAWEEVDMSIRGNTSLNSMVREALLRPADASVSASAFFQHRGIYPGAPASGVVRRGR